MNRQFFFSTKALLVKEHKFLAVYKVVDGQKRWDLPGGRMEFGETAEETLNREIKEELGIRIKPIKLIDTWNYMANESFQVTGVIYYCDFVTEVIKLSDEHDGLEWIDISDIGKVFNRAIFVDRMKAWNWDQILNKDNRLREYYS